MSEEPCVKAGMGFNGPDGTELKVCVGVPQPKNMIDGVALNRIDLMSRPTTPDVVVPGAEEELEEPEEEEEPDLPEDDDEIEP